MHRSLFLLGLWGCCMGCSATPGSGAAPAQVRPGIDVLLTDSLSLVRNRRIGLVTVYRTLKLLMEAGLAHERQFGEGRALFEHASSERHHDHMICTHCGKITEFENCEIEALQEEVARRLGFTIQYHKLELYGRCSECRADVRAGTGRVRSVGAR